MMATTTIHGLVTTSALRMSVPYMSSIPDFKDDMVRYGSIAQDTARSPHLLADLTAALAPLGARDGLTVDTQKTTITMGVSPRKRWCVMHFTWYITHIGAKTANNMDDVNDAYLTAAELLVAQRTKLCCDVLNAHLIRYQ